MVLVLGRFATYYALTEARLQDLACEHPLPLDGYLTWALPQFDVRSFASAPEEDVPYLERNHERLVFVPRGMNRWMGTYFQTYFVHPILDRVANGALRQWRGTLNCQLSQTDQGIILKSRRTPGLKDGGPTYNEAFGFADDQRYATILCPERNLDQPHSAAFLRESLAEIAPLFREDVRSFGIFSRGKWPRFEVDGGVACVELLPGLWLAIEEDEKRSLIICSAKVYEPTDGVPTESVLFASPTTIAVTAQGIDARRRDILWTAEVDGRINDPVINEVRTWISAVIRPREAYNALSTTSFIPRPFWWQRYSL